MRILEMKCQPVGPLAKAVFFESSKNCTVVFDDNEAGKTALVDIIVNMLFRRSTAQSRFQSRRFSEYDGYVKLEHCGKEITCTGEIDLDNYLKLPSEFSKLPIVRGSDLNFLWSGNREKKGPLIEACIQHFSADLEDNLDTVVTNIRAAAGLPAKRNCWTKGKSKEIQEYLDFYRKKDTLLSSIANKDRISRSLQTAAENLSSVKKELAGIRKDQESLVGERQAALCAAAKVVEGKLSTLRCQYRDGGYERCSRKDLHLWTETAAEEKALREKEDLLKKQIDDTENKLLGLRRHQDDLARNLKETEDASKDAGEELARKRQEQEKGGRARADLLGEVRALLGNAKSAMNQKDRIKWAVVAVAILGVAALVLFLAKLLVPGGTALIAALAVLGWSLTVSSTCGRTVKDAEEKVKRLAREVGVQSTGALDAAVFSLERHFLDQERKEAEELERLVRDCQEKEQNLQKLVQERLLADREVKSLAESLQKDRASLQACTRELDQARRSLQDLMQRTGKPERQALEKALQEKEQLEREIEKAQARLGTLLGSEDEWREKLLALSPYLEAYPAPRSLEDLDCVKENLEGKAAELNSQEQELQREHDTLLQQEVEESRSLYAAGCGDLATLALRLTEAEQVLKDALKDALAALWAQQAVEAAKEGFEDLLLDPLTRAGELFYRITGRYDTLNYSRDEGDVLFSAGGEGFEYSEDQLSDGTQTQLLLALRFALLERILGDAPGFLLLDDPLLSSSEKRKQNAIEVLLDYARQGWQVIYLTVDSTAVNIFRERGQDLVEFKKVSDFYQ